MKALARRLGPDFGRNLAIVVGLVGAGFVGAWLRFSDRLVRSDSYTDGSRVFDAGDPLRHVVWDEPVRLDALCSPSPDSGASLAPDGRLVVFASGESGLDLDLYASEVDGGAFGPARALEELDTVRDELAPCFAGGYLYFASDRPGSSGGLDVYRAPYSAGRFGPAERLDGGINSSADDTGPAPCADGSIVLASNRKSAAGGGFDLYRAAPDAEHPGRFAVEPLATLNTPADEVDPALSEDGRWLLFASDRPGSGGFDLYRTMLQSGAWLEPERLAGLDTERSERAPSLAEGGFALVFSRAGDDGDADLFRARSTELFAVPGRPAGWLELILLLALLLVAAIAALAKRWPELDIVWKCLLASVAAHLLLLWWFRHVGIEPGAVEHPGSGERFRVRGIESERAIASRRERGGRLDGGGGNGGEGWSAPVRAPLGLGAAIETSAPGAPEAALAASEDVSLGAPGRGDGAFDPSAGGGETAVLLRDAPAEVARDEAAAPPLALGTAALAPSGGAGAAGAVASGSGPERFRGAEHDALSSPPSGAASGAQHGSGSSTGLPFAPIAAGTTDLAGEETGARSIAGEIGPGTGSSAPGSPRSSGSSRSAVALHDAPSVRGGRGGAGSSAGSSADSAGGGSGRGPAPGELALVPSPVGGARGAAREAGAAGAPRRWSAGASDLPESRPAERAVAPAPLPERDTPALTPERWEHTPYQARSGTEKARAIELHGGSEETEEAVRGGLAYLARIQQRLGNWGDADHRDPKYGQVAVGKTGLALLAFLGAGHTHQTASEYSDAVRRALAFLLAVQDEDSGHFGDSSAYSHGIATFALAECYALTGDALLREPIERGIDQILANQDRHTDPRLFGGWSYFYPDGRTFDPWPRVSITAWQVMALESARLGGIDVPDAAFDAAREFLQNAEDPRGHWYRYSHDPERLGSGFPTLPASTPAALFALSLLGEDVAGSGHSRARAFVLDRAPRGYRYGGDEAFVQRAEGNLYFWYYATLAMFRTGGGAWEAWNDAMKRTLLPAQAEDGSWPPIDIYARTYARDHEGDKSYTTAMCVLSLEVYYRYYLPLLRVR